MTRKPQVSDFFSLSEFYIKTDVQVVQLKSCIGINSLVLKGVGGMVDDKKDKKSRLEVISTVSFCLFILFGRMCEMTDI